MFTVEPFYPAEGGESWCVYDAEAEMAVFACKSKREAQRQADKRNLNDARRNDEPSALRRSFS